MNARNPSAIADELAEMKLRTLASCGDGHVGVFWSEAGGPSPWELYLTPGSSLHSTAYDPRREQD